MSEVRDDRHYTETHEWVLDNGDGTYVLGISDHAQTLLGDIVYVELPNIGDSAIKQDEFCVVESVKAASSIYAPAGIEIIAVNDALEDDPALVNSSCYDDGWLVKFTSDGLADLMDATAYTTTLN